MALSFLLGAAVALLLFLVLYPRLKRWRKHAPIGSRRFRLAYRLDLLAFALRAPLIAGGSGEDEEEDDEEDGEDEDEEEDDGDGDDEDEEDEEEEDEESSTKPPKLPEHPGDEASAKDLKKYADAVKRYGDYWKKSSRRWEKEKKREPRRAAKRAREAEKKLKAAEKELDKLKGKDKSASQKAIDEAKREAREEAAKETRADRLETTVTRLAAAGVEIEIDEDGDTKSVTVRAADPEDVLARVERAIRRGDLDEDDVFDENHRVQSDEIKEFVAELLEDNPRLRADAGDGGGKKKRRAKGSADTRKGRSAKSGDEKSVEDELADVRRNKK